MLKKCKDSFKQKFVLLCKEINNINDIILMKVNQNKWVDIVNLSVIAIILHKMHKKEKLEEIYYGYDMCIKKAKFVMEKKNSDYGNAWITMEYSSIKDIILQKIFRIQNIEKNLLKITNSHDKIQDNYIDVLNYCIFLLIKEKEEKFI